LGKPEEQDGTDSRPGTMAISASDVSKIFGVGPNAFTALDAVSINIARNEFFTLLGPSGCGKTTLLRLIAGFEQASSGTILLNGKDISADPPYKRPVNTVFQSYALFPHMTVAQNISFGLEMLGRPKEEIEKTTAEMLALVKMEPMANRKIAQISGGQQQRVALARALAPKPQLLLLDEPLSALDLQLRKEMQLELKRLQKDTGITFIFVTHDQEEALTMSDRIAVMNTGKILQVGTPHEIYDQPKHRFVASFIGEINLVEAEVKSKGRYEISNCGSLGAKESNSDKGKVSLAVRPERISLGKPGEGKLPGRIENIVFHGTDTIFHFVLPDGTPMRARSQNSSPEESPFVVGNEIGWSVDPRSVSVLEAE
jgi:spermidine/putrescine transport system ATP-binding protein